MAQLSGIELAERIECFLMGISPKSGPLQPAQQTTALYLLGKAAENERAKVKDEPKCT